ncbi:MAG: ribonuclease Z, partial [Simkaniaceae bacterium]|nr:ribonuclease Z [Simkaniaceae bacterium]
SSIRKGDIFTAVIDTRPCDAALRLAKDATMLLCESTYLDEHVDLAHRYKHMTAKQAAQIARDANAKELVLTHFSARYRNLELFEQEAQTIFPNTHAADDLKTFPFKKS